MQSLEIRAVESTDFDIWLPLWKGYQRFYEVDIPESVTLETWARFLQPNQCTERLPSWANKRWAWCI